MNTSCLDIVKFDTPIWLNLLPAGLRGKILCRPRLIGILSNTVWLFSDRVLRMGVGLIVGVWMARYLGPEQFGLLSFAMAFVALFGAVASLGLQGIVVRDIVRDPALAPEILGTGFVLQLLGGLAAFVLVTVAIAYLRPDDATARLMVAILGAALVFRALDGVRYWFESQVQSKYVVWAENAVFLGIAAVKVGMILAGAPLVAFAWAAFAEVVVVALALAGVYLKKGGRFADWRVKLARAVRLLKDSWPLVLSGLAIMVYMRIDQIMLGQMLDDGAVGIYTAAVRISEVWYFIPTVIVASVFPAIIESKKLGEAIYLARLQKLYSLMVVIALVVAVPLTFLSDWLVVLLFGDGFASAGLILAVHIWAGIFVFLGVASGQWFLVENLQKYVFYRTVMGAVANVALNAVLIPAYGVVGAALATVISQAAASVLFNALNGETRAVFVMQCRSFFGAGLLPVR